MDQRDQKPGMPTAEQVREHEAKHPLGNGWTLWMLHDTKVGTPQFIEIAAEGAADIKCRWHKHDTPWYPDFQSFKFTFRPCDQHGNPVELMQKLARYRATGIEFDESGIAYVETGDGKRIYLMPRT